MATVAAVATVRAVILQLPPAVIVSPVVHVTTPAGLFTTTPEIAPPKFTVWSAVPVRVIKPDELLSIGLTIVLTQLPVIVTVPVEK